MPPSTFLKPLQESGSDPVSRALDRTLLRYASLLRRVAREYQLPSGDADEVLQEVRIRLWRSLSASEKILAVPPSYVYRVAVSAALDLFRRRRARREDPVDWLDDRCSSRAARPDQALGASEMADELSRSIAALAKPRRVVVRLHLAGYHRTEIARLLNWTEAKTRNLLYRGLADLRRQLVEVGDAVEGPE
ncbi:MAG: RNA polymerase sigma factor [Gemmatimonadetes bacterium]|nr:RNA polymerase sigma factor [Gemmatimonadota bacterium]NIS02012.1 RNA polymerase sigma factor [Gemmatimonadota bacterium]NIV24502.1 sigma-70 family RNA polymerase sigma factor [Gemmatimonadota bacterium]NIW76416.1 sigma-70 family RNA polymerase sigma factor [Gemmatimonadota bacterium]